MATHSSILVWKIPWTEEPGGLQSRGSQNSWGHDLATKQQQQLNIWETENRSPGPEPLQWQMLQRQKPMPKGHRGQASPQGRAGEPLLRAVMLHKTPMNGTS